ncbi:hypothetical protein BU107_11070 [Staphylococcus xylosus]|uniref:hypothetical protein n=1 Tax=Staphylococcus xylosus TaxID=1288 RepID=UPI000E68B1D6|nr:hypothetical protein [Staphylococcus xylosus]RIM85825.1 hypothetical protein BU107_11070 [Staphylococcus xylosus]
MKKFLPLLSISLLVLTACENNSEEKKTEKKTVEIKDDKSPYADQEKRMKKYLGKIVNSNNKQELERNIDIYNKEVKKLDAINPEIGDYVIASARVLAISKEYSDKLEKFKKANPNKVASYDLASSDLSYNTKIALTHLKSRYDSLDIEYKNSYLGEKTNEKITNMLAEASFDLSEGMEASEYYGKQIKNYSEDLNEKQKKFLSNPEYRKQMMEIVTPYLEQPSVSKVEYNSKIEDINETIPSFLKYEKIDKLVPTSLYNDITTLKNGITRHIY